MQQTLFHNTIQEQFILWLEQHKEVYELFTRFAAELLDAGHTRYSSRAIIERIRWHYAVRKSPGEEFTLNNNFTSRLARKLMEEDARFKGFFEVRELKAA